MFRKNKLVFRLNELIFLMSVIGLRKLQNVV